MFLDQEAKISDPRGGVIASPPPPFGKWNRRVFLGQFFKRSMIVLQDLFCMKSIPPFLRPRDSKIAADFCKKKKKKMCNRILQDGVGESGIIQFVENYFVESLFDKVIRSINNLLITSSKQVGLG
jgi:hypothetical protein